jgi:hypothetical protein
MGAVAGNFDVRIFDDRATGEDMAEICGLARHRLDFLLLVRLSPQPVEPANGIDNHETQTMTRNGRLKPELPDGKV